MTTGWMRMRFGLASLASLLVLLGGCGGGDDEKGQPTPPGGGVRDGGAAVDAGDGRSGADVGPGSVLDATDGTATVEARDAGE